MRTRRARKGIVLVWVSLLTLLLVGALGFACDYAYVFLVQEKLQTVADGASLAGARQIRGDVTAVNNKAQLIASLNTVAGTTVQLASNPGNAAGGDIVMGQWNPGTGQFTPTLSSPNAVKVVARYAGSSANGPVSLLFGPIFGVSTTVVQRSSIAVANLWAGGNSGIIVLNPSLPSAMSMNAYAKLTIKDGDVQVNSSNAAALTMSGQSCIAANNVYVVGGYSLTGLASITGNLQAVPQSLTDPLAGVPAPPKGTDLGSVKLIGKQSKTLDPGYYSGGISNGGSGSLTLNPGIYVLDGTGLSITGSGAFTALGVMVYVTGKGTVNLTGNGLITMTPPDPTVNTFTGATTYQGISIFQDSADTSPSKISGNGTSKLDGVVYLPTSALTLAGYGDTFGSQIIVNTLVISGNGNVIVDRSDGHLHPSPVSVYLVQ